MKKNRADIAAEDGFFPWPREVPAEWILKAHPVILAVSALVLFHQFAPLPSSPMGYVSEIFVLTTAYSMLAGRGRRKPKKGDPQDSGNQPGSGESDPGRPGPGNRPE